MTIRGRFIEDARAQAIGISHVFLSLAVLAVIFFIITKVTNPLFDIAKRDGSGQVATNGTTWLQQGINFIPVMGLGVVFFGLIAYAVFSREVLGG